MAMRKEIPYVLTVYFPPLPRNTFLNDKLLQIVIILLNATNSQIHIFLCIK